LRDKNKKLTSFPPDEQQTVLKVQFKLVGQFALTVFISFLQTSVDYRLYHFCIWRMCVCCFFSVSLPYYKRNVHVFSRTFATLVPISIPSSTLIRYTFSV